MRLPAALCCVSLAAAFAGEGAWSKIPLELCRKVQGVPDRMMGVCLEGKTLYAIGEGTLYALDVTQPLAPVVLGSLSGMDNNRQVVSQDGFAYVVSRETGLRIVDARNPKDMRLCSRYDSVEFATGIDVVGRTAFLSERINGVEVVDISDPNRPVHVCIRKTGESQSNRYRNGYLYSGEWGAGAVTVFDAHDLKGFRAVKTVDLGGFGDGVEIAGDFLYCSTGHDARHRHVKEVEDPVGAGRGLEIFSLEDPANPKWVSRVDFPVFKPRNEDFWTPRVANGFAFCCDSHNGLFIVDARNPHEPKPLSRFCVPENGKSWPSGAVSSCAVGEGCIYVTASPGGLWVVPVEGVTPPLRTKGEPPANPSHRERYETNDRFFAYRPSESGQARTVVIRGDIAYVAFGDAGLHVLKVSEKGFERVGILPGNRRVTDCCLVGDKLLTAEGTDGFAVYELPSPAEFREVSRRASVKGGSVAFWCCHVEGDKVILSARRDYSMFSISDICAGSPLLSFPSGCQWDKYPADGAIDGRFPVLFPRSGLIWLDFRRERPKVASFPHRGETHVVGWQVCGLCRFGGDRYLYTVKNGEKPAFVFVKPNGEMSAPLESQGCLGIPRADGTLVLVTNRSGRKAYVWDFAQPQHPRLLREYQLSGNPDIGTFFRGKAVIPAGHQGLIMEK